MPDPVISEVASTIHVRHIQTPIESVELFTRRSETTEVLSHLERHDFDATPVFPSASTRGGGDVAVPDGLVWKTDLKRQDVAQTVNFAVQPLTSSVLIDSNASLLALLERFRDQRTFLLVVGNRGLEGIVTPSDMNKQAGRTHLFMHVSALELALSEILRSKRWPDDKLLQPLAPKRRERICRDYKSKLTRDMAADLVACLYFPDVVRIGRAVGRGTALSQVTDDQIASLADFRNKVVHATTRVAADDDVSTEELLTRTDLISTLLDALGAIEA